MLVAILRSLRCRAYACATEHAAILGILVRTRFEDTAHDNMKINLHISSRVEFACFIFHISSEYAALICRFRLDSWLSSTG